MAICFLRFKQEQGYATMIKTITRLHLSLLQKNTSHLFNRTNPINRKFSYPSLFRVICGKISAVPTTIAVNAGICLRLLLVTRRLLCEWPDHLGRGSTGIYNYCFLAI